MNDLDWLVQHRFTAATYRDHDWLFAFDGQTNLIAECLWRLIDGERIQLTSNDASQQFGLLNLVDASGFINVRLANATVVNVTLRDTTLDLQLTFDTGHTLEFIPDSSGFEAWNVSTATQQFIATGGGELVTFDKSPENPA